LGEYLPLHPTLKYLGVSVLVLGSVALAVIGLIPRINTTPHNIASIAFFTLIPSGIFIIGLSLIKTHLRYWGTFSLTIAISMTLMQVAPWPWAGDAIPQILSSLLWSFWTAAIAIRLLLKNLR